LPAEIAAPNQHRRLPAPSRGRFSIGVLRPLHTCVARAPRSRRPDRCRPFRPAFQLLGIPVVRGEVPL